MEATNENKSILPLGNFQGEGLPPFNTLMNMAGAQAVVAPSQPLAPPSCTFSSHIILMKGITWSRDSHGLFDYESKHLTKKTMRTTEAVSIVRRSNELSMI